MAERKRGRPIEVLLVEDDPADARLTLESLSQTKIRNHVRIGENGDAALEEAADPDRIAEGHVIVAGDPEEPFLARVVDIVEGADGTHIVHLDVIGLPGQVIDELTRAKLLPA